MLKGSCLCGSIRYEIDGNLDRLTHCHCSQCRKAHGAAFGSYVKVERSRFRLLCGEESIVSYVSSPGVRRTFCARCGATLQFIRDSAPDRFSLALGTLDSDPGALPSCHIFVASKAPWFEITDGSPQYEQYRPAAG